MSARAGDNSQECTNGSGSGEPISIKRHQSLTFRPSVDDPEELSTFLKSVIVRYNNITSLRRQNANSTSSAVGGILPTSDEIASDSSRDAQGNSELPAISYDYLATATPEQHTNKGRKEGTMTALSDTSAHGSPQMRKSSGENLLLSYLKPPPNPQVVAGNENARKLSSFASPPAASLSSSFSRSPRLKETTPMDAARKKKSAPRSNVARSRQSRDSHSASSQLKLKAPPLFASAQSPLQSNTVSGSSTVAKTKAAKRRNRKESVSSSQKSNDATGISILDEDTRKRIKRVQANSSIDIYAPDPELDAPPGEAPDERRKRLERINGRRKRTKKFIEIDHYHRQITELFEHNLFLRSENEGFRQRIDMIKGILEEGKMPSRDLLCLPEGDTSRAAARTEQNETQEEQSYPVQRGACSLQAPSQTSAAGYNNSAVAGTAGLLAGGNDFISSSKSASAFEDDVTAVAGIRRSVGEPYSSMQPQDERGRHVASASSPNGPVMSQASLQILQGLLETPPSAGLEAVLFSSLMQQQPQRQLPLTSPGTLAALDNFLLQQLVLEWATRTGPQYQQLSPPQQNPPSNSAHLAVHLMQYNTVFGQHQLHQYQPQMQLQQNQHPQLFPSRSGASENDMQQQLLLEELSALLASQQRQSHQQQHPKQYQGHPHP